MGLFDKMKQAAATAGGNQTVTFTFQALPESLAQMQALPEASLDTPFKTAALTVCALCAYGADKNIGLEMLNWLRGPRPHERAGDLLPERPLPGRQELHPVLLLCGCVAGKRLYPPPALHPAGGQQPHLQRGGRLLQAVHPLRRCRRAPAPSSCAARADGQWFLWEQYLMTGIRIPASADPWA